MKKYFLLTLMVLGGIVSVVYMQLYDTNEQNINNSYSGAWISKNYYDKLIKTKSPREAQSGSSFLVIPNTPVSSVNMITQFHEGVKIPYGSLSIKKLSGDSIEIDGEPFVKVDLCSKARGNIECSIGNVLLKGDYITTNNQIVKFEKEGIVTGLGDFKHYKINLDYYDIGMNVDMIILGRSEADTQAVPADLSKWLGFQFNSDVLNMYEVVCKEKEEEDNICDEIEFGRIKYVLKKITN